MKYLLLSIILVLSVQKIIAQDDTWIETNTGIADFTAGESFKVSQIIALENGRTFAFVIDHSEGEDKNGIYEYIKNSNSWEKVIGGLNRGSLFFCYK